jgi:hypothetical protein
MIEVIISIVLPIMIIAAFVWLAVAAIKMNETESPIWLIRKAGIVCPKCGGTVRSVSRFGNDSYVSATCNMLHTWCVYDSEFIKQDTEQ